MEDTDVSNSGNTAPENSKVERTELLTALWTDRECARQLRVDLRTLRRWHTLRQGPPKLRLWKRVYYRPAQVQAWLDGLTEAPPQVSPPRRRGK
jgi:hypothetical protein